MSIKFSMPDLDMVLVHGMIACDQMISVADGENVGYDACGRPAAYKNYDQRKSGSCYRCFIHIEANQINDFQFHPMKHAHSLRRMLLSLGYEWAENGIPIVMIPSNKPLLTTVKRGNKITHICSPNLSWISLNGGNTQAITKITIITVKTSTGDQQRIILYVENNSDSRYQLSIIPNEQRGFGTGSRWQVSLNKFEKFELDSQKGTMVLRCMWVEQSSAVELPCKIVLVWPVVEENYEPNQMEQISSPFQAPVPQPDIVLNLPDVSTMHPPRIP